MNTNYEPIILDNIRQGILLLDDKLKFLFINQEAEEILGCSINSIDDMQKSLEKFKELGFKVLIGLSRKSFLDIDHKILPDDRLEETIAMNSLSAVNGADILRVHDVEPCIKALKVIESYIDC